MRFLYNILFLFFLIILFHSNLKAQAFEEKSEVKEEVYVRPVKTTSDTTKKVLKFLKKQKKKEEKLAKSIEKKRQKEKEKIVQSKAAISSKTDHWIDKATGTDTTAHKEGKLLKKGQKALNTQAKDAKNQQVQHVEQEVTNTLKNTKEIKEAQQKLNDLTIDLPDSSQLLKGNANEMVNNFNHLKSLPKDSLAEVLVDTLKSRAKEEAQDKLIQEGGKIKEIREGHEIFNQAKTYKTDSANVDKIAEDLLKKTKEGKELQKIPGEDPFSGVKSQNEQLSKEAKELQEQAKKLQDQEQMKKYAKEKASKLANQDLAKYAPQIQQAQQDFAKYKKKMEWIKEGSGPKANSLKDEPLKKRLIYGANLQVPTLDPFSIVAAPFVGYRINKKFSSGIGATYKITIGYGKNVNKTNWTGSEYGYRVFTDYKLVKGWFGHAEYEQLNKTVKEAGKDSYKKVWNTNGYIGVGRQIDMFKGMKINVMFLCNLLHKDLKHFNTEAFQFRFGVSK